MALRSAGKTASSVGMMEGAFFVSRTELLEWVNGLLQVSLDKVEQCASGAIYCQIIDACQPGSVAMRKVNWMAKAEHEYIPNFKVLQAAFDRLDIARNIPVDQLIRGKYQDNLEFLQWLKCYWEKEGGAGHRDYDAVSVRQDKTLPQWAKPLGLFRPRAAVPRVERRGEKENQKPRMPKDEAQRNRVPGARVAVKTPRSMHGVTPALRAPEEFRGEDEVVTLKKDKKVCFQDECWQAMKGQLEEQKEEILELRANLDGLERERDYYFRKLREVEILCLTLKSSMDAELKAEKVVEDVQGILYAENEVDDGQVDEGQIDEAQM